jgi:hypothetical protein
MIVGYGRVSTDGQTLDAQEAALRAAGAERVCAEKISGAVTDRKASVLRRRRRNISSSASAFLITHHEIRQLMKSFKL